MFYKTKRTDDMSLVSKPTDFTKQVREQMASKERGQQLIADLSSHIEDIGKEDYFDVLEVEELVLREQAYAVEVMKKKKDYPTDIPRFSPSSAGKSKAELYLKAIKAEKDEKLTYPFQNRWTRNSTAVHGAMQKTLLEAEVILQNPMFTVMRLPEKGGLPAWEKNIERWKVIEHNGQRFVIFGMCDGILEYKKDGTKVGFEYKTKSNSVAQIKQIKEPNPSHIAQTVAYAILFEVDEWLITYESVAKDKWTTNENARPDFKIFYNKVTEADKKRLLDKWADVAKHVEAGQLPDSPLGKFDYMFFPYKKVYAELTKNG
ncbi:hypothetical protein [Bacillus altitudinis]|uniref:hypothetical protein n=1 Tax=Bacillus altitudinis TaxID=293387 RepID=UPI002100BC2E|nr:hypothetical protein [Bacillus altitudinis]UTV34900.1 hypothetical protein NM966_19640 [Bacillus altitudinis]